MKRIKIFNVFISSTFADMQIERDHLRQHVFCQLDAELMLRGARLNVIDLRGSEKSGEGDQSLRVLYMCLEAVDSCRPRFIGLLGDRYGWVPFLVDEDEPAYDPLVHKSALDVIKHIDADKNIHMTKDKMKQKSATHLEMLYALSPEDSDQTNSKLVREDDCFFYERRIRNSDLMSDQDRLLFEQDREHQLAMKREIKKIVESGAPGHYSLYEADWDTQKGCVSADSLDQLCDKMLSQLRRSIEQELLDMTDYAAIEQETSLFIMEKLDRYVQPRPELDIVKLRLKNLQADVLMLTGEAGTGKSTLMAQLFSWFERQEQQGHCRVVFHAAGLNAEARTERNLLLNWISQLEQKHGIADSQNNTDGNINDDQDQNNNKNTPAKGESRLRHLRARLAQLLLQASVSRKVYLLIDSVDSLEDTYSIRDYTFLPEKLHAETCLIVSALPEKISLPSKLSAAVTIQIEGLNQAAIRKALEAMAWFQYGKSWNSEILNLAVEKCLSSGGLPMYAHILVGHLMNMTYEDFKSVGFGNEAHTKWMRQQLEMMPETINELYEVVFSRVRRHDSSLSKSMDALLGIIAVSREGLDQQTLTDAVAACTGEVLSDIDLLSTRGLLRGHLRSDRQGWWDFEHQHVRRYLLGQETGYPLETQKRYHEAILEVALSGGTAVKYDHFFGSEFFWHAYMADLPQEAAGWLADLPVEDEFYTMQAIVALLLLDKKSERPDTCISGRDSALSWILRTMDALSNDSLSFRRGFVFFCTCFLNPLIMERIEYSCYKQLIDKLAELWDSFQPQDESDKKWQEKNAAVVAQEFIKFYSDYSEEEIAEYWLQQFEEQSLFQLQQDSDDLNKQRAYASYCSIKAQKLSSDNQLTEAEQWFTKSVELYQQIWQNSPDSKIDLLEYLSACRSLASIYQRLWKTQEAKALRQHTEALCRDEYKKDQGNIVLTNFYADLCANLGESYATHEDRGYYISWYQLAIDLKRRLHEADPSSIRGLSNYAWTCLDFGIEANERDMVLRTDDGFDPDFEFVDQGDWHLAEQMLLQAQALYQKLVSMDPENPGHQKMYQVTSDNLEELYARKE